MSIKISKTDLISDITVKSPQATKLLAEYGLACAHCFFNRYETVEQGASFHGMSPEQIDDMIDEINSQLKIKSKKLV